tara:strand:+ start:369 stop:599 length:231 start_codon:yes stop_codon:yes gene_type:complete
MSNKTTQNKQILNWLESGKSITPLQALEQFGCFRLSARIFNLRENGYQIVTKNITKNGKTFAEYSLDNQYFVLNND